MLKQRIITAVVLLAILLPLMFHERSEPFCAVGLLMIAAGGWEWGRLNGLSHGASVLLGCLLGGVLAMIWLIVGLTLSPHVWWLAGLIWLVATPWLLRVGGDGWKRIPRLLRISIGLLVLSLAWLAMAQARLQGVNFLLSIMAVVWMADVAAYFGGKAFGRRKLAPTISPGKSWAGVYSGFLGVALLAVSWSWADTQFKMDSQSLFTQLNNRLGGATWAALAFLTAMSVVGDLIESLVKRSAGFKDSSNLLPGHGGVLDRVDALLPVMPLALLMTLI